MKSKLSMVSIFIGAFLVTAAVLSHAYIYPRIAVVPLSTAQTSIAATAAGDDGEYLDLAALAVRTAPLKSDRVVAGDADAGKKASKALGRDVAVWESYSCTDTATFDCSSGETPLSASLDVVAFDRNTGEVVPWSGSRSESNGKTVSPAKVTGLYYKFPFNTQKKDYKFWDSTLNEATTAKYAGEGEVKGLHVYKFTQTIAATKVGEIEVPGTLIGSKAPIVKADRMYAKVRQFSIEPETGVVIVGAQDQDNYLAVDGERKLTTTKASLRFTDERIADSVDEYKGSSALLAILRVKLPVGGLIVGIVFLAVGVIGARRAARPSGSTTRTHG